MKRTFKALSVILCLILVISSFCACTYTINVSVKTDGLPVSGGNSQTVSAQPTADTTASTTQPQQTEQTETTTQQAEQTTKPAQSGTQTKPTEANPTEPSNNGSMSTAQIVELYNTAVNKVKPEAKKIVRHYDHQSSDENYLEMPSAIQGVAKTAMGMFIKGSDEEQVWTTADDFKIGFPVGGEDYSSHLKPEMVKTATCKDNGSTYDVDIVLYDDAITSPSKGEGYAGVFNTVSADSIKSVSVPGVTFEKVDVNGINGHITCKIDKATKRVTDIVFTNTDILDMSVKVIKSFTVKFAFACETSYSIEY